MSASTHRVHLSEDFVEQRAADYRHLIGHRLPGGTVTIPAWMNQLWADASLAPDPTPTVHPGLVYSAALEGAGVSFQDIFDLMDGAPTAGIFFGSQRLEFDRPLVVGREYIAEGTIVSVERKNGKRTGPFDILTFKVSLRDTQDGMRSALSTSSWIFGRRAI